MEVVTPGSLIDHQLAQVTGIGLDQLNVATEVNQIINALLNQLAQKALTSLDGIRGLSSKSSSSAKSASAQTGGTGSYLDQLVDTSTGGSVSSAHDILIADVTGAISLENEYQTSANDAISALGNEKSYLATRYQCYLSSSIANSTALANAATSTISAIGTVITGYKAQVATSATNIAALTQVESAIDAATTSGSLNNASNLYDILIRSGLLHTLSDVSLADSDAATARTDLATLKAQTGDQCLNI